jgi:catechol 2,3-dioxygenase-like lactoylglutathione lyase family enzyme
MSELTHAKAVTFILTKDLPAPKHFYQDKLGLKFKTNEGFADVYDIGDAVLQITEIPGRVASAHPDFGREVTDIAKAAGELVAAGVKMTISDGIG